MQIAFLITTAVPLCATYDPGYDPNEIEVANIQKDLPGSEFGPDNHNPLKVH
jgi:hypothetical protein